MRKGFFITAVFIATLFLAAELAGSAFAQTVTCRISAKFSCDPATCSHVQPATWNIIDFDAKTYSRCDTRGCDKYDALFSRSGVFINVDIPGRGLLVKFSTDMSAFLEVATMGTRPLISFGACQ